jgi:hypothetical protein
LLGQPPLQLTRGLERSAYSRPMPRGLLLSGYLQLQYQASQASEDQLQQGGTPLNQDEFLVRRARLRIDRGWEYAAATLELDGNYARGPSFGIRRAEGSIFVRGPNGDSLPPLCALTLGLFDIPFGFELVDSAKWRYFMERSLISQSLFPSEPDMGVKLSGALGFVRYSLALVNGEPLDGRPGRYSSDPNAAKDLVGRFGVDVHATENLRISGGTSFLNGKGFHPGQDATKDTIVWRDINENGQVDTGELVGAPGVAATPSQNFRRWAFGADLQIALTTLLGRTVVYGEAYVASNLDRALFVADPVLTQIDVREVGFYAAFIQEIATYGVVGFRYDQYDPNADSSFQIGGKLSPYSQTIRTYSPLVGLVLPDQARLVFQYDHIQDKLGKDSRGVPSDLRNDQWTLRLQVNL